VPTAVVTTSAPDISLITPASSSSVRLLIAKRFPTVWVVQPTPTSFTW